MRPPNPRDGTRYGFVCVAHCGRDPFGQTLFLGAHVVWVRKCHLQSCTLRRSANVSNEVSALESDTDDDSENVAVPEERSETNARTRV